MDSHMRTELVVDALEMAVWRRKPSAGLVHHSRPRRPVYGDLLRQAPRIGWHRSFDGEDRNGPGQSTMAESFIATLKTELVHRRRFPSREVAKSAISEYLEGFYNRRRLHSAFGYRSPVSYEEATMEGVAVA
jgi:putative transposase